MANAFSRFDADRIVAAIVEAEKKSSGEVRVHVTRRKPDDIERRALERFHRLGMAATKARNGVLLYIAPRARRFRIVGDVAIHEKCGESFWTEVAQAIEADFRRGAFTDGVVRGVERIGEVLAEHFPREAGDANELPDRVTED
jgi:uncharacterized membrane protein